MKVELLLRNKEDNGKPGMESVIEAIKKSVNNPANAKPKIGTPMKDEQIGSFVNNWKTVIGEEFQEVDISAPLGVVLAVKDEVGELLPDLYFGCLIFWAEPSQGILASLKPHSYCEALFYLFVMLIMRAIFNHRNPHSGISDAAL